jgi:hypothetical protein
MARPQGKAVCDGPAGAGPAFLREAETDVIARMCRVLSGKFLAAGADGYLAKPFSAAELYSALRQFMSTVKPAVSPSFAAPRDKMR